MADFEHNSEKFGYINVEDLSGVQDALNKLGYSAGTVDGKNGPNTQKAVRAFQAAATIKIDGIVGPDTRQALVDTLTAQAAEEKSRHISHCSCSEMFWHLTQNWSLALAFVMAPESLSASCSGILSR